MTKEKAAKVSLLESRRATKSAKQAGYKRAPSISKVPEGLAAELRILAATIREGCVRE